jgi:UDP-N-acetylglucosamine 2-epimerase (non-hydrolysing)
MRHFAKLVNAPAQETPEFASDANTASAHRKIAKISRSEALGAGCSRPEAVKMAPVIQRLRRPGSGFTLTVLTTGQHRGLLDQALADFAITSDHDLGLMRPNQRLADITGRALEAIAGFLAQHRPDLVLAQGDTSTVLATALARYYERVPFGHVEAGLRTRRPFDPFPEEKNRELVSRLADIHEAAQEPRISPGLPWPCIYGSAERLR